MKVGPLDLGGQHPYQHPVVGQVVNAVTIESRQTISYSRGAQAQSQTVVFSARAWQPIGGNAALTPGSLRYLVKQLEELGANPDMSPAFIQWTASADPAAVVNASELHDGWYIIDEVAPNWDAYPMGPEVPVRMTVVEVAPGPPSAQALAYSGGSLASNATGAAQNIVWYPVGSTTLVQFGVGRTGAEGNIPGSLAPVPNPVPFLPSAAVAQWFQGGVHVYDTLNTSANPVPTTGGTFIHANWVEVFDAQHDFVGDCVITNGLLLLLFQVGAGGIFNVYLWNVALATANWQSVGYVWYQDEPNLSGLLRSYQLVRVGGEECAISTISATLTPHAVQAVVRLQRGAHHGYLTYTPLTQAMAHGNSVIFHGPAPPKILYNSGAIRDDPLNDVGPVAPTDYEFGAAFANSSAFPLIWGWLHQNQPGGPLPFGNGSAGVGNADVGQGDGTSLAVGSSRLIAFFAYPYGVSGVYSPANLQAEGESGSLGTGWSSVADAAASGGNAAKCASGTLIGNTDDNIFGAAQKYATGSYRAWFRIRVASAVSGVGQMTFSIYDGTSASVLLTATIAPTAVGATYVWYSPGVFGALLNHNIHAYVQTAATLTTDWFVDEVAIVPLTTADGANRGPQDLWQQFRFDRDVVLDPA